LILEIARCASLVRDGRPLGFLIRAPLGFGEIDGACRIVREDCVAQTFLNGCRRDGRRLKLGAHSHFNVAPENLKKEGSQD